MEQQRPNPGPTSPPVQTQNQPTLLPVEGSIAVGSGKGVLGAGVCGVVGVGSVPSCPNIKPVFFNPEWKQPGGGCGEVVEHLHQSQHNNVGRNTTNVGGA